jgi:hypothetical protein
MSSAFRDPKNLSEWIELDYFRRSRFLGWLRRRATWVTLGVSVLLVGGTLLLPWTSKLYQAGPVSTAHAMFNDNCAVCHTESLQTLRRFWPGNASVRAVPDEACLRCHDGPPHNAEQVSAPHCAGCHREHRGREALARLPDSACLACHARLKDNTRHPDQCRFRDVTGFPDGHPEFALWLGTDPLAPRAKDPGKLRFNHQVHLRPEGVPVLAPVTGAGAAGGKLQTEHLECDRCHRQDSAGRYMLPIRYEDHCRRCHPLTVMIAGKMEDAGDRDQKEAEAFAEAVRAFAREPAPHPKPGESAELVRAALRERFLRFAREHPVVLAGREAEPVLSWPGPRSPEAITEPQWRWARGQLEESERLLFVNVQGPVNRRVLEERPGGCAYCHIEKGPVQGGLPEYERPNLRQRWLPHSRFSHESHRMLDCTQCHAARGSSRTEDVLLPKLETCARCHNARAGARSDCVECHGYHDRGHGPEPTKHRTIDECLGR